MSTERLEYIGTLLESAEPLPDSSRVWLRDAILAINSGTDPRAALGLPEPGPAARNEILRAHALEIPARSLWGRCKLIAGESQRIHRGRKTQYKWIREADLLKPLPESARQIANILK